MSLHKLLFLLLFPIVSYAADGSGLARSVGKYAADDSVPLAHELASRPAMQTGNIKKLRSDAASQKNTSQNLAAHPLPAYFEIFDSWVELSGDLDDDGYYHQIRIMFDADVNTAVETVYVKLYLSREGGDWYQYATSDLFEIYSDSVDDTYEVVTELLDGYQPGFYEVMIELHSLYHPGVVASRILNSFNTGVDIALEDLSYDESYRVVLIDDGYADGHSGSFSLSGLMMLALLLIRVKFGFFKRKFKPSKIKSSRALQKQVG